MLNMLPPAKGKSGDKAKELVDSLNQLAVEYDCVGSLDARPFQSYSRNTEGYNGNYGHEFVRSRNCSNVYGCNLKNEYPLEIEDKYQGVCQSCKNGQCYQVTRVPSCRLQMTSVNNNFYEICEEYRGHVTDNGYCIFPSRQTRGSCIEDNKPFRTIVNKNDTISVSYCYDPTIIEAKDCIKGKWKLAIQRCVVGNCSGGKKRVPAFVYSEGLFMNNSSCNGSWCSGEMGKDICGKYTFVRDPYCDDFEYYNAKQGLCVTLPSQINHDCDITRSGLCIIHEEKKSKCAGKNGMWISKATNQTECLEKEKYCAFNGNRPPAFFKGEDCTKCGGKHVSPYAWIDPSSETGHLRTLNWVRIAWAPKFIYTKGIMSLKRFESIAKSAVVQVLARQLLKLYQPYLNTYLAVFKAVECSCFNPKDSCFSRDIKVGFGVCDVNKDSPPQCDFLLFANHTVNRINVEVFSVANYIDKVAQNTVLMPKSYGVQLTSDPVKPKSTLEGVKAYFVNQPNSSQNVRDVTKSTLNNQQSVPIQKRCNPISVYEVLHSKDRGISGQIIGNGMKFYISNPPVTAIKLCLPMDLSIPTDNQKYRYVDIGFV